MLKKCQENVLQFMFLYIIRTPLLELKMVGKNVDYTWGKIVDYTWGKTVVLGGVNIDHRMSMLALIVSMKTHTGNYIIL